MEAKSLHNTTANDAKKNVKDIQLWGDDLFKLLSKASSESEGWMKSTKAMAAGNNVVVQVTTQQRNPDGSYSIAEALTLVPNSIILEFMVGDNVEYRCLIERNLKEHAGQTFLRMSNQSNENQTSDMESSTTKKHPEYPTPAHRKN